MNCTTPLKLDQPAGYHIEIQGHLTSDWADYLNGMDIYYNAATGISFLDGAVKDQAALQGILTQLYNLGYPLLTVVCRKQSEPR